MGVVKTGRIGCKAEPALDTTGQRIRQNLAGFDITQLVPGGSLASLLYFVQEQPAVRGNADGIDGRVDPSALPSGVNQQLIVVPPDFAHIDATLFLCG
jgi:hypothetical protein